MNDSLTDYDRRQIVLMKNQLEYYESNKMDLGSLISRLDSLLKCLKSVKSTWKKRFFESLLDLESVYADAIDKQMTRLSLHSLTVVANAVQNIKNLILEALD